MSTPALRFALVTEFVIVLVAALFVWVQVAGQDRLDLIPWYWKLLPACGLAVAFVQATAAAVKEENAWNTRTMGWLVTGLAVVVLMAALTSRYQLYEPVEEGESSPIGNTRAL
jgi:hypothetical protein